MKLPLLTKFTPADFKDLPAAVQKIIGDYYTTFLNIYAALNKSLNTDNLDMEYKELTVTTNAAGGLDNFPMTIPYGLKHAPNGITVIYIQEKGGAALTVAPWVDWVRVASSTVRLKNILGLAASKVYNLRLRIE